VRAPHVMVENYPGLSLYVNLNASNALAYHIALIELAAERMRDSFETCIRRVEHANSIITGIA